MNTLIRAVTFLALFAGTTTFAAQIALPTALSNLVDNVDFVVVGDLTFDTFKYDRTGDMPSPDMISVSARIDGDDVGLRFLGGYVDTDSDGASTALIEFRVQSGGGLISAAHLQGNPDLLGGQGLASVTETFLPLIDGDSITVFDNGSVERLRDSIFFVPPVAALNVQKAITLRAEAGSVGADISFVDQTFSLIPEPGSLTGMFVGFLALGSLRRRRHLKT